MTNNHKLQQRRRPLRGFAGIDADSYLFAATPGTPGSTAGFWVSLVFSLSSLQGGDYILSSITGIAGWGFVTASGGVIFQARGANTLGVDSPFFVPEVNSVYCVVGVHDGSRVRLYSQGTEVGSGTPITGYSAITDAMYIGAGGAASSQVSYYGSGYGLGAPTAQNVKDWYIQSRNDRRIAMMPGVANSRLWLPADDGSVPTDIIGGVPLVVGAPGTSPVATRPIVWGIE